MSFLITTNPFNELNNLSPFQKLWPCLQCSSFYFLLSSIYHSFFLVDSAELAQRIQLSWHKTIYLLVCEPVFRKLATLAQSCSGKETMHIKHRLGSHTTGTASSSLAKCVVDVHSWIFWLSPKHRMVDLLLLLMMFNQSISWFFLIIE